MLVGFWLKETYFKDALTDFHYWVVILCWYKSWQIFQKLQYLSLYFSGYLTSSFKISLNRKNLQKIPIGEIDTRVSNLELKYNELNRLENRTFENHANIAKLNLWSNKITFISSGAFYGISNLRTLELGRNRLTEMPDLTQVFFKLNICEFYRKTISHLQIYQQ